MSATKKPRTYNNIYAKLNDILNMIVILEDDYEKQEQKYLNKRIQEENEPFKTGTLAHMENELLKAAGSIRQLRIDAQRLALQHGEEVAVWWAIRNHEVLKQ